jgi:hypothetical protein
MLIGSDDFIKFQNMLLLSCRYILDRQSLMIYQIWLVDACFGIAGVALLMPCREAHESLKQQKVSLTGLQPTTALVLTRRSIFGAQSGLKYLELISDKLSLRLNF